MSRASVHPRSETDSPSGFFLFENELALVLNDPTEAAAASARIAARKAELAEHESFDAPDTLCGGELAAPVPPTAEGLEFLSGIGVTGFAAGINLTRSTPLSSMDDSKSAISFGMPQFSRPLTSVSMPET